VVCPSQVRAKSLSLIEKLPMTMQVGIVADTGIVLASDTKFYSESSELGLTITGGLRKIRIGESGKIAVSCAYALKLAFRIAGSIVAGLSPQFWPHPTDKIIEIISSELDKVGASQHECLIVLAEPTPKLYVFSSGEKTVHGWLDSVCWEVPTYAFCGHKTNASIYWADRFFRPVVPRLRSMEDSVTLAAQIIFDAGKINSNAVGGLEVIKCDAAGIHVLTAEENIALEAAAHERSMKIEQILFCG